VLVPSLAPLAVVGLYFTPVSLIGCTNRGLIAFGVVLLSLLAGIAAAIQALRLRSFDRHASALWALSASILAVPAVLVLGPLG
jgi:hypothetical protein